MSIGSAKPQEPLIKVGECLYRTKKGVYFAWFKVKRRQVKKSLKTDDRQLANRRLAELRQKAQRMQGNEHRNIRFSELAQMWLEAIEVDQKANSLRRRKTAVKGLEPFFLGMQIRSIGFAEIEEWRKRRGAVLSARSHNIELETLTLIFKYGINRGIIWELPTQNFKRRKENREEVVPMSKDQFTLLIIDLRNSPKASSCGSSDLVEFLAYSGLRIGEAREILRRDVSLDQGTVRITGGETGTKNHKERTIQIYPNVRKVLERVFAKQTHWALDERVFKIDTPRKAIDSACKRLGLPHATVHSLRHFFATNVIETGAGFNVVGNFLGHSDRGVLAARTYGHLRPEISRDIAEKLTFQAIEDEPSQSEA